MSTGSSLTPPRKPDYWGEASARLANLASGRCEEGSLLPRWGCSIASASPTARPWGRRLRERRRPALRVAADRRLDGGCLSPLFHPFLEEQDDRFGVLRGALEKLRELAEVGAVWCAPGRGLVVLGHPRLLIAGVVPAPHDGRRGGRDVGSGSPVARRTTVQPQPTRGRWFEANITHLRVDPFLEFQALTARIAGVSWARSSVGRAPPSHGGGHEFESRRVHPKNLLICRENVVIEKGPGENPALFDSYLTVTRLPQGVPHRPRGLVTH